MKSLTEIRDELAQKHALVEIDNHIILDFKAGFDAALTELAKRAPEFDDVVDDSEGVKEMLYGFDEFVKDEALNDLRSTQRWISERLKSRGLTNQHQDYAVALLLAFLIYKMGKTSE